MSYYYSVNTYLYTTRFARRMKGEFRSRTPGFRADLYKLRIGALEFECTYLLTGDR